MSEDINQKPVKVYYCRCGKSIVRGGDPEYIERTRSSKKEYKEAAEWGRKVETITLEEFHKTPFMCAGVPDCPDFGNMVTLAKQITDEEDWANKAREKFIRDSRQSFFDHIHGKYD